MTTTWVEAKPPAYVHTCRGCQKTHLADRYFSGCQKNTRKQRRYFSVLSIIYVYVLSNYFFQLSFCCLSLATAARIIAAFPDVAPGVAPSAAPGWLSLSLLRLRQHVGRSDHDTTVGLRERGWGVGGGAGGRRGEGVCLWLMPGMSVVVWP